MNFSSMPQKRLETSDLNDHKSLTFFMKKKQVHFVIMLRFVLVRLISVIISFDDSIHCYIGNVTTTQ